MSGVFPVLVVALLLFLVGAVGFLAKRNLLLIILSLELMLHGIALNFVAFSQLHRNLDGQVFVVFMLIVAASEAGLAMAISLGIFRRAKSLDLALWNQLREQDLPAPMVVINQRVDLPEEMSYPKLTTAGSLPASSGSDDLR